MTHSWMGWYFSDCTESLRYGDGRKIYVGITHTVECRPVLFERGLHASASVLDALEYAPGTILWRVSLGGTVVHGVDKSCATERTYHARLDATDTLRAFARRCALQVVHLWDAPELVKRYLETGDETYAATAAAAALDAAMSTSWDAAWAAARSAARSAACAARSAAWDAACGDAARSAAWDARSAAWDAALNAAMSTSWDAALNAALNAAWDAARAEQRATLEQMIIERRAEFLQTGATL